MRDDTGQLKVYLDEALDIIRETRKITVTGFRKGFGHRLKDDLTEVTDIDLAVEEKIRYEISSRFPDHGILGEEFPSRGESRPFVWIIDPIDGTKSLSHRIPLFGTLLALRQNGTPVIGIIDLPLLGLCYSGGRGMGVFRNGERLPSLAGAVPDPDSEIIGVQERRHYIRAGRQAVFDTLILSRENVRMYCDCHGHSLVLEGSLGAMVDFNLRIWDFAATEALIREAGGAFVCVGRRAQAEGPDRVDVIFGKPQMVDSILAWTGIEPDTSLAGSPPPIS